MKTRFIEASQSLAGPNWGKFMVGQFEAEEWSRVSVVDVGRPLLRAVGWRSPTGRGPVPLLVTDLQTGEGGLFVPAGSARHDLQKHRIWVCVLFEDFLVWLYQQDLSDIDTLPSRVLLPETEFAFAGYRRPGPASGLELRKVRRARGTR